MTTKFGFVSTYPPTLCGLATFTAALRGAMTHGTVTKAGDVVRLLDVPQPPSSDPAVSATWWPVIPPVRCMRPELLEHSDVVIVQHEYGVYGGRDGDEVLMLLEALTVPTVVVLHTVLSSPTPHQSAVLEEVAAAGRRGGHHDRRRPRDRLADGYAVDMRKVSVIPHGAPPVRVNHAPLFRSATADRAHLGPDRPRQGHRVGHRGDGLAARLVRHRATSSPARPTRRCCCSEGEAYREPAPRQVARLGLARHGDLGRPLPRPGGPGRTGRLGRRRAAAVRLDRPGHLRAC